MVPKADMQHIGKISRPEKPPVFKREQFLVTQVTIEVDGLWMSAEEAVTHCQNDFGNECFVITGWNPWCQSDDENQNIARNVKLSERLLVEGGHVMRALGEGRFGNWPTEESFAVWGLKDRKVKEIARDFLQEAVFVISENIQTITSTEADKCWIRSMAHDEVEDRVAGISRTLPDVLLTEGGYDSVSLEPMNDENEGWLYLRDFTIESTGSTYSLAHNQLAQSFSESLALIDRNSRLEVPSALITPELSRRMLVEFELAQAEQDVIDREVNSSDFQVYVIEFDPPLPAAREGQRSVYVGETSKEPESRFLQHKDEISKLSNRQVLQNECRLNWELFMHIPKARTRRESRALEALTAEILRDKGFHVIGGH